MGFKHSSYESRFPRYQAWRTSEIVISGAYCSENHQCPERTSFMEEKQALKYRDSQSTVPSYQDQDTSILPLPAFITRAPSETTSDAEPLETTEQSPSTP